MAPVKQSEKKAISTNTKEKLNRDSKPVDKGSMELVSPKVRQRERFIHEYPKDLNAKAAAIRAGYSKRSAAELGHRLLKHPDVKAALAKNEGARLQRIDISVDRTLRELGRLAFYEPKKLFTPEGNLIPIHELDDDTAAAIAGLEVIQIQSQSDEPDAPVENLKKIKLVDKRASVDMLMRHHGLYHDKTELDVKIARILVPGRKLAPAKKEVKPAF